MATKRYSALDLQRIPLQGLRLENLSSAPSSPQAGDAYFDTVLNYARIYNGSTWEHAGDVVIADGSLALAKLATDPLARGNHTGAQAASTISDFAAAVLAAAVALRLDQFAAPTAAVGMGGQRLTNGADPAGATDFTTQQWVLDLVNTRVNGLDWKRSVRVVATTNINIASAPAAIDGVTMASGERVLLAGQTTASANGIYDYNGSGAAMTRSSDADSSAEVTANLAVFAGEGTYADTAWQLTTNDAVTLGTTALTFTQFGSGASYSVGSGLSLVGTTFSLTAPVSVANGGTGGTTAALARTGLGVAQAGFASDVGALTAGVGLAIPHGLATADLVVMVRNKSTGAMVLLDTVVDATNITLTSALAVGANVLRVTAVPVA